MVMALAKHTGFNLDKAAGTNNEAGLKEASGMDVRAVPFGTSQRQTPKNGGNVTGRLLRHTT